MKYVTFTNTGSVELCDNFLQSAKNLGMDKDIIVYCLDDCREYFSDRFQSTFRDFKTDQIESSFHEYGQSEFRRVTENKVKIILDALEHDDSIVYTDCDVVFRKNPIDYILENDRDDVDIFFASDLPFMLMCTGFMYIKNRAVIKELFGNYFNLNRQYNETKNEHMFDQEIINLILSDRENLTNIKYGVYPLDFVANGHTYFSESTQTGNECVVHVNFTIGKTSKINRLKEKNLWFTTMESIS